MTIEGEEFYDIACKVVASVSVDRFTVKVNKDPDVEGDPNALFAKVDVVLKKGENILRLRKEQVLIVMEIPFLLNKASLSST